MADPTPVAESPRKRRRWFNRRNLLVAAIVLVVLYALIGFVGVPLIAQKLIIPKVNDAMPGTVVIDKVRCNPFTLRITLEGIDFDDRAAGLAAEVDRVVVDAQWSSIWSAYRLRELTVDKPVIAFTLQPSADATEPADDESADESPLPIDLAEVVKMIRDLPRAAMDQLAVNDGEIIFADLTGAKPFEERVYFKFAMNDFDTLTGVENVSRFEARTDGGGIIESENTLRVDPLMLAGTFEVKDFGLADYDHYTRLVAAVELEDGVVAVTGRYRVDPLADPPVIEAVVESHQLTDLAARSDAIAPAVVSMRSVHVGPIRVDVIGSRVEIDALTSDGLRVLLMRDPEAPIPLPPEGAEPAAEVEADTEPSTDPATAGVSLAHEEPTPPSVDPEPVAEPLPAAVPEPMPLLVLTNENGQTATLIDLASPWTVMLKRVEHTDHRVAVIETLPERGSQVPEILPAPGNATDPEPLLTFERLLIEEVVLLDRPLTVSVAMVRWEGFAALGKINEDGRLNTPFVRQVGAASGESAEAADRVDEVPPLQRAILEMEFGPIIAKVDRIELENGRIDVCDRSQRLPFEFPVTEIGGEITGVSTDHAVPIVAKINAALPGEGRADISGNVLRDQTRRRVDFALVVTGMSMQPFTPYTGRFVGFGVEDGRLNLDIAYELEGSHLKGGNAVALERFYLGESVESSEAIQLPVKLGLSLLRDGNEEINLDPQVEGDLDDPAFKVGPVVVKAFTDVFTNVISSPFSFIGDRFGGGEMDLSFVAFEPGSASVTPGAAAKLDVLGKAMAERPQLMLVIAAGTDETDLASLRKQKLVDTIRASDQTDVVTDERYREAILELAGRVGTGQGEPDALETIKATQTDKPKGPRSRGGRRGSGVKRADENAVSLQELIFGGGEDGAEAASADTVDAEPTFAELEARILATIAVTEMESDALSSARAEVVRRYLIDEASVDGTRLSIAPAEADTAIQALAAFKLQ